MRTELEKALAEEAQNESNSDFATKVCDEYLKSIEIQPLLDIFRKDRNHFPALQPQFAHPKPKPFGLLVIVAPRERFPDTPVFLSMSCTIAKQFALMLEQLRYRVVSKMDGIVNIRPCLE